MPLAVIHPTSLSKTATDRSVEEAQLIFPFTQDTGLDTDKIPIVIVFNGLHHYCGTKLPQSTFKDGITEIVGHLQNVRFLCDNMPTEDVKSKRDHAGLMKHQEESLHLRSSEWILSLM